MTVQCSTTVRNAILDVIETTIGTAPSLLLISGTEPANCAAAQTGTTLATITLPSDWMSNASAASKALLGTWSTTASAAGTATHFRINAGATCHMQGTVGTSGTDMVITNTVLAISDPITVSAFTLGAGNA
jgi:hypothetical protein